MLDGLERPQRGTELVAGAQVIDGLAEQALHDAQSFRAAGQCRQHFHFVDRFDPAAEAVAGRNAHFVQSQGCGDTAVRQMPGVCGQASCIGRDEEQAYALFVLRVT